MVWKEKWVSEDPDTASILGQGKYHVISGKMLFPPVYSDNFDSGVTSDGTEWKLAEYPLDVSLNIKYKGVV